MNNQFFFKSAHSEINPNAKNRIASIRFLLRNASINAIPKNSVKTAIFVNFMVFTVSNIIKNFQAATDLAEPS